MNLCICLSYPLNFGIYCGMSRQFRETFKELFMQRVMTSSSGGGGGARNGNNAGGGPNNNARGSGGGGGGDGGGGQQQANGKPAHKARDVSNKVTLFPTEIKIYFFFKKKSIAGHWRHHDRGRPVHPLHGAPLRHQRRRGEGGPGGGGRGGGPAQQRQQQRGRRQGGLLRGGERGGGGGQGQRRGRVRAGGAHTAAGGDAPVNP